MTACRWLMPNLVVSNWDWLCTMSRIENAGNSAPCCLTLLDGERVTPSPRASTTIKKDLPVSTAFQGFTTCSITFELPPYQLGKRMPFVLALLSCPYVR